MGFRGEAPSKKAGHADKTTWPASGRDNARPVAAEWGSGGPTSGRVGFRGKAPSKYDTQ